PASRVGRGVCWYAAPTNLLKHTIGRRAFLAVSGAAAAMLLRRGTLEAAARPRSDALVHPGCLHSEDDLERMAARVAAGARPWIDSWNILIANPHAQLQWRPRPVSTVVRGGPGENYSLVYNDAAAAYACALRWNISGDPAYGDKAVEILN